MSPPCRAAHLLRQWPHITMFWPLCCFSYHLSPSNNILYIFLFAYCLALLQNYNLHEKRVFFSFVLAQLPACRRMSGTFQNYLLNKSTNGTLNEAELNFIVVVFTDLLRAFARLAHGVHSPFNKRKEHFHLNLSDLLPQMLPKKHTQD